MKKILTTIFFVTIISISYSQGINFQGVARTANGTIIAGSNVSLRLSIISKTVDALPEYVETKTVLTNTQGIFSIVVGDASNTAVVGSFKNIVWSEGPKFLKVEMDPAGGSNYLNMGSTQLQNVPFSYFSYGVNAANVNGILPITSGGTGASSLNSLKSNLGIDLVNNVSDVDKPVSKATQSALDAKAPIASPTFTGTVGGITKAMVGLSAVDNTSDLAKPISNATQTALDTKVSNSTFSNTLNTKVSTETFSATIAIKENAANKSTATDLGAGATSDILFPTQKAVKTYVDAQINSGGVADGGIITAKLADAAVTNAKVASGIDKSKVGLGNVDNTSDLEKPISTLTQAALDEKASTFDNVFTGRQMINGTSNGYVLGISTAENGYWMFDEEGTLLFPNNTRIVAGTNTETILNAPINGNFSINTIGEYGINNWKFKANGNLQLPYNSFLISDGEDLGMVAGENQSFFINTSYNDISRMWNFNPNGVLRFPDDTKLDIKFGGNENWLGLDLPNSKDFIISTYNDPNAPSNLWTFKSNGEMIFPDGSMFGQFEGEGTVGFLVNNETEFLIHTSSNSNDYEWDFNKDGSFDFPDNTKFTGGGENSQSFRIELPGNKNLIIKTKYTNEDEDPVDFNWRFDSNGELEFPDETIFSSDYEGTGSFGIEISDNHNLYIKTRKTLGDEDVYYQWRFDLNGGLEFPDETFFTGGDDNLGLFRIDVSPNKNLKIRTLTTNGDEEKNHEWLFKIDGQLILPDGSELGPFVQFEDTTLDPILGIKGTNGIVLFGISEIPSTKSAAIGVAPAYWFKNLNVIDTIDTEGSVFITTSHLNYEDENDDELITSQTVNTWKFSNDGELIFPDGTITSGSISGTTNFGFDTHLTNSGFSIITGTSTGTTKLWTFDNNGVLNLPSGGDIRIGESSVLSSNSRLNTQEFYVNAQFNSQFGRDLFDNNINYNSNFFYDDNNINESWLFPLQFTPISIDKIVVYFDGIRIPKFSPNGEPLFQIVQNGVHIFIDKFAFRRFDINSYTTSFDLSADNEFRINIDYQY